MKTESRSWAASPARNGRDEKPIVLFDGRSLQGLYLDGCIIVALSNFPNRKAREMLTLIGIVTHRNAAGDMAFIFQLVAEAVSWGFNVRAIPGRENKFLP
ncbi:MAG: hypothetical protein HY579_05475 [Nitrospinae bacterium]|nr:hypothetical protein [Nitrospinota bacterium]